MGFVNLKHTPWTYHRFMLTLSDIVNGDKPYGCSICGRKFSESGYLAVGPWPHAPMGISLEI